MISSWLAVILTAAASPPLDAAADHRLDWAEVAVRRAYHARLPPIIERMTGLRLVAVDVEVRVRVRGMFDPGQLAIADAERGDRVRAPALVHRLTAAGQPADARDPVFAGDPDRFRLLLVSALPGATGRIRLRYGGAEIAAPASITAAGPTIPAPSQRLLAHAAGGRAPLDGHARHRVLLEARDWSRVAEPHSLALVYRLTGTERRADADRWIEVDGAMRPVDPAIENRPLVIPVRRFVLEYWLVEGGTPIAVELPGRTAALPDARLLLPDAADRALAGAAPDLDASHYRAE